MAFGLDYKIRTQKDSGLKIPFPWIIPVWKMEECQAGRWGLPMPGARHPPSHISLPFLLRPGNKTTQKNLMGWNKARDIGYQLPSGARQTQPVWEIILLPIKMALDSEKQKQIIKNFSPLQFWFNFTFSVWTPPPPVPRGAEGWTRGCGQSIPAPHPSSLRGALPGGSQAWEPPWFLTPGQVPATALAPHPRAWV